MAGEAEKPKGNADHDNVISSSVWMDSTSNWWQKMAL